MFTYEVVQQCALHCGYSPFNNVRFLVYLYCIGFRQRHRLYNCFTSYFYRVFDSLITQMLLSKHSFCVFSPQRPLYVGTCLYFVFAPLIVNGAILVFEQLFYSLNVLNTQVLVIFNKLVRVLRRSFS